MSGTSSVLAAVVFDLDGVLVDSVDIKTEVFAALYEREGPEVVAQVVAYHRDHGGVSRQRKFAYFEQHLLGRPATDERIEQLSARFAELVVDRVVAAPEMPHATEVLQALHGRLPLFVASGTPEDELREIVARRGLPGYFEGVHGSPATKSAILDHIAVGLGADPSRLLMVGDSVTDLAGATDVGAQFVGYAPQGDDRLGGVTISDLRQLVAIVADAPGR